MANASPPVATVAPAAPQPPARPVPLATKICFLIRPMGDEDSPTRHRSEEVQETYLDPACAQTGYDLRPSDELGCIEIGTGIVCALSCAPMTIAYLGSPPWNDDVMVELGYRLASSLPLVIVCDAPKPGVEYSLPLIIRNRARLEIPPPGAPLVPGRVKELVKLIRTAQQMSSRIDSQHPMAIVHYHKVRGDAQVDAGQMHYIAASEKATALLGIKEDGSDEYQLVGHTLREFLDNLQYRMPPRHYDVFRSSQDSARTTWSSRIKTNDPVPPAVDVPIVFDRHPNPAYVGRAFLPVVVSEFRSEDKVWCNLKVLYLEVTSHTLGKTPQTLPEPILGMEPSDPRYFVCPLADGNRLTFDPPDHKSIGVFLSYNSLDHERVEQLRGRLVQLTPAVNPWLDRDQIDGADDINRRLNEGLANADVAFIFIGKNGPGRWQNEEVETCIRLKTERGLKIMAVFLDGIGANDLPKDWGFLKNSKGEAVEKVDTEAYLIRLFDSQFGERFYY